MLEPVESGGSSRIAKLFEVLTILGKITVMALDLAVLILTHPDSIRDLKPPSDDFRNPDDDQARASRSFLNIWYLSSIAHYPVFGFNILVSLVMLYKEKTMKFEYVFHRSIYRNYIFLQLFASLALAGTQFWSACKDIFKNEGY